MKASQTEARQYNRFVSGFVPPRPVVRNALLAFLVGGTICAIAQLVLSFLLVRGIPEVRALGYTAAVMIALGSVVTAFGVYDEIGRVGGMGAALPITGFANSIVSEAMEFRREGLVLGVGARMFSIAGPVIVYGLLAAALVTVVRLVIK